MLSVSDKSDSVNECTQEISELMKLHIQGVWQNVHKFIRQLAYAWHTFMTKSVISAVKLCPSRAQTLRAANSFNSQGSRSKYNTITFLYDL